MLAEMVVMEMAVEMAAAVEMVAVVERVVREVAATGVRGMRTARLETCIPRDGTVAPASH